MDDGLVVVDRVLVGNEAGGCHDHRLILAPAVAPFRYIAPSGASAGCTRLYRIFDFIDPDVSFRELPAGKVLGSRKYNTASTAWQGIFSAMTSKQVRAICEQIVADLRP
jgi:hypothetical protein